MNRLDDLIGWFDPGSRVMVALSGGVDSGLVAYAAHQKLGDRAVAVTADYKTLSEDELDAAKRVCREIGISHILLSYDELQNPEFVKNGPDRCFHCRTELGLHLGRLAKRHGTDVIVDGTNADDLGDYRPGIDAMRRHKIRSPLVETGFTKSEIRECARSAGLSFHDRPSNSCLASRIPWGQRVTAERLARIEMGETIVRQLARVGQVRVRDIDGCAKIEVEPGMLPVFDESVTAALSERLRLIGFTGVTIDPDGYRPGKINVIAD